MEVEVHEGENASAVNSVHAAKTEAERANEVDENGGPVMKKTMIVDAHNGHYVKPLSQVLS